MEQPIKTSIPHIDVLQELEESLDPILSTIEPLHAYLYSLSITTRKKDRLKPFSFYFLLENIWEPENALNVLIPFYREVTYTLLVLSEIEKHKIDFKNYKSLNPLLLTAIALKNNISDISADINGIKDKSMDITSKMLCKRLFHYTESVRALIEELVSLKVILLEEITSFKNLFLTKEPLDLKGDLE
jgi:hypothetical protein